MGWFSGKSIDSVMEEAFKKGLELSVNHQGQPDQFRASVQNIFATKLARVNGDKNLYVESMLSNTGYLVTGVEFTYSLFYHHIQNKSSVITENQFWGWVKHTQDQIREDLPKLVEDRYRKSFAKFTDIDKKIDELQFTYLYNSSSHQIILAAVCELLTVKANVDYLFGANFNEVMEAFQKWNNYATNYRIGNLAQKAG